MGTKRIVRSPTAARKATSARRPRTDRAALRLRQAAGMLRKWSRAPGDYDQRAWALLEPELRREAVRVVLRDPGAR